MANKRGLSRLTKKEKLAAAMLPEIQQFTIPDRAITVRLKKEENVTFDFAKIIPDIRAIVDFVNTADKLPSVELKPRERIKQASDLVALIDEIALRLEHIDGRLYSEIDQHCYRQYAEHFFMLKGDVNAAQAKVRECVSSAIKQLKLKKPKSGPKVKLRTSVLKIIAESLQKNSTPAFNQKSARALAREILDLCDKP